MNKYIDADLLLKEIEKRLKNIRDYMSGTGMKYKGPKYYKAQGKVSAYDALLSLIDSCPGFCGHPDPAGKPGEDGWPPLDIGPQVSEKEAEETCVALLLLNGVAPEATIKQLREVAIESFRRGARWKQKTAGSIPEGPKGPSGHPDPSGKGLSDFIQDSLDAIERIYNLDGKDWDVVCNLKYILLSILAITASLGYEDLHGKTAKLLGQIMLDQFIE